MIPPEGTKWADGDKATALASFIRIAISIRTYRQQVNDLAAAGTLTAMVANNHKQTFANYRSMIEPFSPQKMPDLQAFALAQFPAHMTDYAADHAQITAEALDAENKLDAFLASLGLRDRVLSAQETAPLRDALAVPVAAAAIDDAVAIAP